MGTPLQFNMYDVLLELQVPPEKAHALSEAYNRDREQVRKEVQDMVEKQLQSYVTQTDATKAEGRVEKAINELRGDIHQLRGEMHKAMNDQLRWIVGTQVAIVGLAIAAFKLL